MRKTRTHYRDEAKVKCAKQEPRNMEEKGGKRLGGIGMPVS